LEILKFCEENSLTGKLLLFHEDKAANLIFLKGAVQKIVLDDLNDAEAMDVLTQWKEGRFKIEPSLFTMEEEKQEVPEIEPITNVAPIPEESQPKPEQEIEIIPVLEEFLYNSFLRLIDLLGSQQLNEEVTRALDKCRPYFHTLENCEFKLLPKLEINLRFEGEWTEKETLAIAVFLETIIKNCKELVFGITYLDFEEIAGDKAVHLKGISFFEYMDHAREFTF
jgi:hypothetical protein